MIPTITKEWTFTTAQTDFAIETLSSTQRALIYGATATCARGIARGRSSATQNQPVRAASERTMRHEAGTDRAPPALILYLPTP